MRSESLTFTADVRMLPIEATGDVTSGPRRFTMTAYTGGPMRIRGWRHPIAIDLAGLSVSERPRPILRDHDAGRVVGHTTSVKVSDGTLLVEGVVSGAGSVAAEIVESSINGFPWQASVGAATADVEFVGEGRTSLVNGRTIAGPAYVARRSTLGELSFVAMGADDHTEARIAAEAATGTDTMTEDTTTTIEAPTAEPEIAANAVQGDHVAKAIADLRAELARESDRVSRIREICAGRHHDIQSKAIRDGWDASKTELAVLRAERPEPPAGIVRESTGSAKVIEAAVCMAAGLSPSDSGFDAKTVEAAADRHPRGIGLQELVVECARANGHVGSWSFRADPAGMLRAAFSTMTLPGIFSSVANKFLLSGFTAVESTWQSIAATRSVSDFKAITSYRLTGGFDFEEIGPGGELKHGEVGEESFQNQARTYGRMFSLTRQDLINDDLGALTAVPSRIGRGAALTLNKVFWRTFLDNGAFFTTARRNYKEGATTAMSLDSLTEAELLFLTQTDPDGNPLALTPSILLVPPALLVPATLLMNSTEVRNPSAKDVISNPHAGKFRVVQSSYLSNASIPGSSAKAWYVLANPAELATVEVCFLNGQQRPVVEQAEADFSVLGVQMRGYFDFGVGRQDWRAGVKFKGEA